MKHGENKINSLSLEIINLTQQIAQLTASSETLQTQLEETRAETENEITELKAVLAEKNKLIQQFEEEKDNEDTNLGTLESNNPYDIDFDSLLQSSTTVQGAGTGSPRHSFLRARMSTVDMRSRRVSASKPPSHISEKSDPPAKPAYTSKETQTAAEQAESSPSQPTQDPSLVQKVEDLKAQVGELEAKVMQLSSAGKDYEKQLRAREEQIETLTQKMIAASMESSETINDLNSQYQEALRQLKKAKGK